MHIFGNRHTESKHTLKYIGSMAPIMVTCATELGDFAIHVLESATKFTMLYTVNFDWLPGIKCLIAW
jgi:hypothetical protein